MTNSKDLQIVVKAKDEASSTFKRLSGEADSMARSFGLGSLSVLGVAASVGTLGYKMVQAAAQFEQTRVAFTTMIGSAEAANTLLKQLSEMSAKTPFEVAQIETAAKQLMAYGIAARDVIPNLQVLGDVAAGVGMDKLPNLVMAFGQVKAATRLTGMELRQFTEAGVPLIDQLAKHFKTSAANIQEMVSDGKVGFKDVQQALADLTGEGGRFHDMMKAQSETFLGRWSTLKDTWNIFLREQGNQLLVWGKMAIETMISIVEWLKADAEGLNYVGKMIYGVSQLFAALGKTVWAVSTVFGGLIRMLWEVGLVEEALVKDMFSNFSTLGTRLKQIFGAIGQAMKGDFQGAADSIKGAYSGLFQNTVSQFGKMKEVGKDVSFGVGEAFKSAGTAWGNFASLKGFDSMKVKLGELPAAIEGGGGGGKGGEKNADKLKKIQDAFDKLKEKVSDFGVKAKDDLAEVTKAIDETVKKMEELTVGKAKDDLGLRQDFAGAYVAQEQKVADLKKQWAAEEDQGKKNELFKQYNIEKKALDERKTIELAYQKDVDEARRRASLTEFQRTIEDLTNKQIVMNQEFEAKKAALETELKMNLDKYAKIKEIQDRAKLEAEKNLLENEKLTVDSVNREISRWNQLAEAMARAKAGKTSSAISASSINSRLEQIGSQQKMQAPITIIFKDNKISSDKDAEKFGNQLVGLLGLNTQLAR